MITEYIESDIYSYDCDGSLVKEDGNIQPIISYDGNDCGIELSARSVVTDIPYKLAQAL